MARYRIASAALMTEYPMGEAHALHEDVDVTLCGVTVPPLQVAWRAGHWPPPECSVLAAADPDEP